MNCTKGGFPIWDDDFDRAHYTAEEIAESDMQLGTLLKVLAPLGKTLAIVPLSGNRMSVTN